MTARDRALSSIKVGDVIFGVGQGGQEKILLVYKAEVDRIFARHVTTQTELEFRRDGRSLPAWDGGVCTLTSTAALPTADYNVTVGLDRKMRAGKGSGDFRLSKDEIKLLLTVHDFFKARPLPSE